MTGPGSENRPGDYGRTAALCRKRGWTATGLPHQQRYNAQLPMLRTEPPFEGDRKAVIILKHLLRRVLASNTQWAVFIQRVPSSAAKPHHF